MPSLSPVLLQFCLIVVLMCLFTCYPSCLCWGGGGGQNLQGQDEIIGVADTGLDLQHCHFSEDDGDSISPSEWDDQITDKTKRKVVQYIAFVDDFDGETPVV